MLVEVNCPFNQDFSVSSPERRERSTIHNNLEDKAWHTENLVESWLQVDRLSMKSPLGPVPRTSIVDIASNRFLGNSYDT